MYSGLEGEVNESIKKVKGKKEDRVRHQGRQVLRQGQRPQQGSLKSRRKNPAQSGRKERYTAVKGRKLLGRLGSSVD